MMKELDVVELIESYEGISKGTKGTIVLDYNSKDCEVEFFDEDGNTIDVITTPKKILKLTWEHIESN